MLLHRIIRHLLYVILAVAATLSCYLYFYPILLGCAFPAPNNTTSSAYLNTVLSHTLPAWNDPARVAPFRLLAFGDPQLEGDTSLPDPNAYPFPHLSSFLDHALRRDGIHLSLLQQIRCCLHDLVDFYFDDIPRHLDGYRKRLDLAGNDLYLSHIYRTLHWWSQPTHVTVLGDLLGSQWIDDGEFAARSKRFWHHVFRGAERIPEELMDVRVEGQDTPALEEDAEAWTRRIINIAGNHDIGYAGDLTSQRLSRFEDAFGKVNYELRFRLLANASTVSTDLDAPIPELRIVVLNSMNLDTPALDAALQGETYDFLNHIISTSHAVEEEGLFTLLLTHIPLHKEAGICIDAPLFTFWDADDVNGHHGVREQNHLSRDASASLLEGIFGMHGDASVDGAGLGRVGLIMTGHDHEGCDVYHSINQSVEADTRVWRASRYADIVATSYNASDPTVAAPPRQPPLPLPLPLPLPRPGIREITLRSMMGEFGGSAGLLSLWFDEAAWEWRYAFATCALGTQHVWWTVQVVNIIALIGLALSASLELLHSVGIGFEVSWTRACGPSLRRQNIVSETRNLQGRIKKEQ